MVGELGSNFNKRRGKKSSNSNVYPVKEDSSKTTLDPYVTPATKKLTKNNVLLYERQGINPKDLEKGFHIAD